MKRKVVLTLLLAPIVAFGGCTPDWATNGNSQVILLMTGINEGKPLDSDVRISSGAVCPDFVALRLENHYKNPGITGTGFRHDLTVERYEVRYFRSDGRNTEGVDVPFTITGNVAQEIQTASAAALTLEVVRRQAKLDPPLTQLKAVGTGNGGAIIVTMFAEVTVHGRTTTGEITNSASARLQIDFADFGDTDTACKTS